MEQQRSRLLLTSFLVSLAFILSLYDRGKAEATPCEAEPTDMSVSYGEQITCGITPGTDTDLYRFSGVTGNRILAEAVWVSGDYYNPRIKLIAPNGTVLGDTHRPARLDVVLPQTGTYTAIISDDWEDGSYGWFYAGEYAFTVSCTAGGCLSAAQAGEFLDISTRGFVGTGSNVLIGGFIIESGPMTVLIRAIGPSLALPPFNVPGVLANPFLQLFDETLTKLLQTAWGPRQM